MLTSPGIWVAEHYGGICNNLKCLLSTMRLAERDGAALMTSCLDMVAVLDGLEFVQPAEIDETMQRHADWRFLVFEDDPLPSDFSRARASRGFADADSAGRNIDHEFSRIPEAMRSLYLDLIGQLKIKPRITEEVERFVDSWTGDSITAVHMRTWMTDHWDKAPRRHQHYFDMTKYEELVESHDRLLICSDNAALLDQLVARYGDRILRYQPGPGLSVVQIAFIELSLLAHGAKLVGSSLSTFTEMAWWLGGCQAEVTLIGANS